MLSSTCTTEPYALNFIYRLMFKEILNKLIPLMLRQGSPERSRMDDHEHNQILDDRAKFVEEHVQHLHKFSDKIVQEFITYFKLLNAN